ncbi:hypothetical protein [Actinomyces bowdenii]|uniref:Leucine rich repeat variant domain-containing protein n=1 Tax=Actinomyces bowdenii TaxID=131109 RepID=A0A3P1VBF6_9ACTO|nr:hypothetical protein [Actinomyces bowdenii]RRD30946.1 hypothetical protein EII10_02380 [Actinomyces bowdenii]
MSQANDELVARAQDPNAPLETLHQLAQNYPSLRPHIAANPRTYPALLKWLGTLGDPDVDQALASRGASPTMSAASAVSAASAASSASAATARTAGSAATAGAAGLQGQGHVMGQSFGGPVGTRPGAASEQVAAGSSAPVNSPASPYSSASSPDPRSTQAMPAPSSYQPRPVGPRAHSPYQADAPASEQQTASQTVYRRPVQATASAGQAASPSPVSPGPAAAAGGSEATVFGVGTDIGTEERSGGAPSGLFLWILSAMVLALLVFAMTWYLTSNNNDPTASPQADRTTAPATPGAAQGTQAPTPSATPSATPSQQVKAPAPDDAVELSSFTSPSGNITCVLGESTVSCTINSYNFVGRDPSCTDGSKPFTASVGTEGQATGSCAEAFRTTGASLNYGASAKNSTFACTSAETGIECWNQFTGQGFSLSRDISETTSR